MKHTTFTVLKCGYPNGIPDQRSFWTATAARLPQASSTYLLHHRGFGQHSLVHNWCAGSWWPLGIKFCYISLAYLVSCPWPVTVAPFRARFGARRTAEKNTIWRTKKRKKKRFGAGRIAEKKHDTANEETQKKARYGAQRKKKKSTHCARRNQQNTWWALHEEIPKTRFFRRQKWWYKLCFFLMK